MQLVGPIDICQNLFQQVTKIHTLAKEYFFSLKQRSLFSYKYVSIYKALFSNVSRWLSDWCCMLQFSVRKAHLNITFSLISQERWYIFVLFQHIQNNKMAYCLIHKYVCKYQDKQGTNLNAIKISKCCKTFPLFSLAADFL